MFEVTPLRPELLDCPFAVKKALNLSNKTLLDRSQREHPEDSQGPGGGHQDSRGRGRLLTGAAGCGRTERRVHHRHPVRRGEERSGQPGLPEPGGPGHAHQRREGRDQRSGRLDAGHQVSQREELPAPRHAHSQGLCQGNILIYLTYCACLLS